MVIMSYVDIASLSTVSWIVSSVSDGVSSAKVLLDGSFQRSRMDGAHVEKQHSLQDTSPKSVTYLN